MTLTHTMPLDIDRFLAQIGSGKTEMTFSRKRTIYAQGDAADAVYFLRAGKSKLTVVSPQGKEAVIAILEPGDCFGECCLSGQTVRGETATAVEDSRVVRLDRDAMIRLLRDAPGFAEWFMGYLLHHKIRIQEDLVDQLLNPSEKRLARTLLLLAHFWEEGRAEAVIPKISQETLAEMIGTTRSRVSFFMNKFRKRGFIEYSGRPDGDACLHVRSSLLKVVHHNGASHPFLQPRCHGVAPGSVQPRRRVNSSRLSNFDQSFLRK
ncbi:Crp/Fnr family transcriptional regulator [Nitrospira sp. NS4]|uniref:Crp/Fnr family transcriptional regulator n=1 Tax=Nitrospira sp. NS4 TaxID=3414498 RepID=UPI003C2EB925